MSEVASPKRRRLTPRGCALVAVAAIAASIVAIIAGIELLGDDTAGDGGVRFVAAGEADAFPRSDVQYFEQDHFFIVRLADGEFIALYDKSPRQQQPARDCRVRWDDTASPNTLPQLEGFRGAFVDECETARAVYRADGEFAFGAGFGRLDRFETRINEAGELLVDVSERTCLRSTGVPGVPPFEEQRCAGAP